jgi:hypothetical protein
VVGFDLAEMIERCHASLPADPAITLTSDWDGLRREQFDLIVASLVVQHIEPHEARAYVDAFASMAPALYLLTRGRSDFDTSNFDLVDDSVWEVRECALVEHDEQTQQLRRLAALTADEARGIADDRHVEALLVPRGV